MTTDTEIITRYTVEFRKDPGDPWQEAESMLPRDERYLATREEAEGALEILREQNAGPTPPEYRIDTIAFDWEDL